MIYIKETSKKIEQVSKDLDAAVKKYNFGVMQIHDLKETMQKKGVNFERDCLIFEVCNPHQAKQVLEINPKISTALPCRISVYQEGERVKIATLKPTVLLDLFNTPELKKVAQEVETLILKMIDEAAV